MTVKQFFAGKTFRCLVVLMCIALVSGAALSICNDLLFVSEKERILRTVTAIYGQEVNYEQVESSFATDVGMIDNVYRLEDGNYLIKATGKNGYKQGTVTIWCVGLCANSQFEGLDKVSIADYDKQTLMSKFTADVLAGYQGDETFCDTVSGATYSSVAINNALNTALAYMQQLQMEGAL